MVYHRQDDWNQLFPWGEGMPASTLSVGQQVYLDRRPARVAGFPFLTYVRLRMDQDGSEQTVPATAVTLR